MTPADRFLASLSNPRRRGKAAKRRMRPRLDEKRGQGSIAVTRRTWGLLKALSDRTGKPMAQIVEELLADLPEVTS